jgi:hypothetical protein
MKKRWNAHTHAEYYEAQRRVTCRIVERLTRGNVNAQNGNGASREKWLVRSRDADDCMKRLNEWVQAGS